MAKQIWKPGNMVYPLPAVMVSTGDKKGNQNILTVAWTGTVCTNPARATDFCGVRSGRDVDKWKECHLSAKKAQTLEYAPCIEEAPVNIECKVKKIEKLGSHHMFLAEVTAVQADEAYLNEKGKFELNKTGLLAYSHGEYLGLGKKIGTFGYSVKKKADRRRKRGKK